MLFHVTVASVVCGGAIPAQVAPMFLKKLTLRI